MNRERIEQLWDDYRDDALSVEDRHALEQVISGDPKLKAMWDAESKWLAEMSQRDAGAVGNSDAFVGAVVDQWTRETEQPVVARIGWRRVWTAVATLAAAAAIVFAVWVGQQPHTPLRPGNGGPTIARAPGTPGSDPAVKDPVSTLMRDMDEQVAQQPQRIREAVTNTASLFNMKQVFNLIQVDVPDPAKYVEPTETKG